MASKERRLHPEDGCGEYTTSYTTYWLKSSAPGVTVATMEEVKSADLRHRVGECVTRAARGETFVVIRYSEPIAVLRPRRQDDAFESLRVTEFWREFPKVLAKARQGGVLITWYSDAAAVLAPLPDGWRRGEAA